MDPLELTYDSEQLRLPNSDWESGLGESWNVGETYPICPQCQTNFEVYCMDCQTHSIQCQCWTVEFYCSGCDIDFAWSKEPEDMELVLGLHKELLRERRIEDVLNEADEILDVSVMPVENPYEGALTLVRTLQCNECGEQNIKHTHHRHDMGTSRCSDTCFVWAPLKDLLHGAGVKESYIINPETDCPNCFRSQEHECVDPNTGEIYYWTVKNVIECTCTPQKTYICSPCNVYRMTPEHPWLSRDDLDEETHVAEFIAAQMGGGEIDHDYDGPKPECKCEHTPAYFCGSCRVARNTPTDEWYALDGYKEAQAARRNLRDLEATKKASNASKTPYSGSTSNYQSKYDYDDWGDDYRWTGMYKCRHYGQEVELLDGTKIYCSSLWDVRKDEKDHPDRGLYFDWSWKPDWRSELSHWPDFGCPTNLKATAEAIKDHYEFAKQGLKVDIGCIGGHGRTGTALACMYILAGAKPSEAGQLVRKQYCKEAIESKVQVWYLTWFDAYINDRPLPEKPVYQTGYKTGGTSGGIAAGGANSFCSLAEHYTQWLANPDSKRCTKRKNECDKFDRDFKDFADGKVDKWVVKNALDIKTQSDFNNIDGFLVPKSKIGEASHNKTNENCACDYCRYTAKGYGAFLDPVGVSEVHIQTPTGIVRTDVTSDFAPQPPREPGVDMGDQEGEYIWLDFEGTMVWVWDAIKYAKQKYMKANVERNKAAKEAAKAASAAKAETSTALMTLDRDGLDMDNEKLTNSMKKLKKMLESDDKIYSRTKRNKKNASRNNGRRRNGKRRR